MTTQKSWRRRTRTQILLVVVTAISVALASYALVQSSAVGETISVRFSRADGGGMTGAYRLDVASDPSRREKGLMFRKKLANDAGMIFIFPHAKVQSFWMKNTYLSLDMLFMDETKKVIGVLSNVPPLTLDPRSVAGESTYVVELAGGEASRAGIAAGSEMKVEGELPRGR